MIPKLISSLFRILLIGFLIGGELSITAYSQTSPSSSEPALSAEQIQRDWMIQRDKRFSAFATQDSDHRPNIAATRLSLEKGFQLANDLKTQGADVQEALNHLERLRTELDAFSENTPNAEAQNLYLETRRTVRNLALKNPLLDFDSILFVKRQPGMLPHLSDQYYGWWSRPGGGIYLLHHFADNLSQPVCLTSEWPQGNFLRPDLSYDAKKVLFAYCRYYPELASMEKVDKSLLPDDSFYHLYEMDIDGSGIRQLTNGRYDDFDARYLPDGEIVFLSTRKGQFVQSTLDNTQRTLNETLPDSYVRCGGDNTRPCAIFTLHRIDNDGSNLRPISAFETFEYNPSIANDGRILYTRWDYIDRFNGHFFSLWSANQDGTNAQLVYGNYTTRPQAVMETRAIPNSNKLLFTASAHHSHVGGSLVLLDTSIGNEGEAPLVRLTPEVPFPETEENLSMYYANPYPLSENYFLTGWSDQKLAPHWGSRPVTDQNNPPNSLGLYLYDSFGNLELLYRDPDISCMYPIPLRPRLRPSIHPSTVDWNGPQEGNFVVANVYKGLSDILPGSIKHLRIVGVPPKTQPYMNSPSLGISQEDPGKFVLGTVPVEVDGSAYFSVPSGISIFFQALNEKGMAVQTMRSLTYVLPQQTLSCMGCHESRYQTGSSETMPIAIARIPSQIRSAPNGSWPLRFDQLIQPVLDRSCISCHSPQNQDPKASQIDLTPPNAYRTLLTFADRDLEKLTFEKNRSFVGECAAQKSRLTQILTGILPHPQIDLSADDWERFITWMDVYAQQSGSFSPEQEASLIELKKQYSDRLLQE